jgi:hypothetical protein
VEPPFGCTKELMDLETDGRMARVELVGLARAQFSDSQKDAQADQ